MEKQKPKLCAGFETEHRMWDGTPSYSCKGCSRWQPIAKNRPFVLEDGAVNCYNFQEIKIDRATGIWGPEGDRR